MTFRLLFPVALGELVRRSRWGALAEQHRFCEANAESRPVWSELGKGDEVLSHNASQGVHTSPFRVHSVRRSHVVVGGGERQSPGGASSHTISDRSRAAAQLSPGSF